MEIQVKSYQRRTKSGKLITVKPYSRKGDKKAKVTGQKVRGNELVSMKLENYVNNCL